MSHEKVKSFSHFRKTPLLVWLIFGERNGITGNKSFS